MNFFFNDTATTEIYTLSLHDALPIYHTASECFEMICLLDLLHEASFHRLVQLCNFLCLSAIEWRLYSDGCRSTLRFLLPALIARCHRLTCRNSYGCREIAHLIMHKLVKKAEIAAMASSTFINIGNT